MRTGGARQRAQINEILGTVTSTVCGTLRSCAKPETVRSRARRPRGYQRGVEGPGLKKVEGAAKNVMISPVSARLGIVFVGNVGPASPPLRIGEGVINVAVSHGADAKRAGCGGAGWGAGSASYRRIHAMPLDPVPTIDPGTGGE